MAKRSSDTRVAYSEVKVQVQDLVRVVGIVVPSPRGGHFSGKIRFTAGGIWAQETCVGCPQQRYTTGEPGKVQGWDHVGIGEGSFGYRARGVSVRGKFVTYPEVKVQVRDLVRVVGIVVPFAPWGSVFGEKYRETRGTCS